MAFVAQRWLPMLVSAPLVFLADGTTGGTFGWLWK
jgi:hypothetical protein